MDAIMRGETTPAQTGAFLMALRLRGESPEEIAGAAESMRSHARRIHSDRRPLLDTCGTGGDGVGTFNISTATAFVAAGAGVAVAKHGNRSVSSRCGSADVLEALGARIDLPPRGVEACLEATGVGFLFAPLHHQAARHVAEPRRELAMRTLFNLLGPLCNPANVTHQLMGVYDRDLTSVLAEVLGMLGVERALVVHGAGGLDELSLQGPAIATEWREGHTRSFSIDPAALGFAAHPLARLRGGNATENADRIRRVLGGEPGAAGDVVALNAGAALYVTGTVPDLPAGMALARDTLAGGAAARSLDAFLSFTRTWTD
jgi:anthranilate phosphoribosyltransferase